MTAVLKLFGMNTAAPSAAASAAFCSRAPSRFQLQKSTAKPAIAMSSVSMIANQTSTKPFSPSARASTRGATESGEAGAGAHQLDEHTALGVGSKRNTLWSVSVIEAPKMWVTKSCRILT